MKRLLTTMLVGVVVFVTALVSLPFAFLLLVAEFAWGIKESTKNAIQEWHDEH